MRPVQCLQHDPNRRHERRKDFHGRIGSRIAIWQAKMMAAAAAKAAAKAKAKKKANDTYCCADDVYDEIGLLSSIFIDLPVHYFSFILIVHCNT